MPFAHSGKRITPYIWLLLAVLIPLLSVYGRSLQRVVKTAMPAGGLALFFVTLSLLLLAALTAWFRAQGRSGQIWHLAWLIPLFLLLPLTLPLVEERLHFVVFGGFGFFSMLLFSPPVAVLVSLAASGLDEALQWALPDRVGDWRDVGFNVIASLGGATAAFFGGRK
ncbi:MAG TPA: VanZ family protein [Thiolapillus brandeum]|uniref:VanZ family protein n=1 Tax=Thiolapillus brandeum TaxID=1076588 RepID=A0A831RWQ5_9GAMM|nr:VanZ family protein [Thiolapillus brandeum]